MSVSVSMPIWTKQTDHCSIGISLPMLGIETVAKNEEDTDKAIEEAIAAFCVVADKFGQGIVKELQSLGWINVDGKSGEPILGYNISDTDAFLERLIQTGSKYANPNIEVNLDPQLA